MMIVMIDRVNNQQQQQWIDDELLKHQQLEFVIIATTVD